MPSPYRELLSALDNWFADGVRAAGDGVVPCRSGCTACCHGVAFEVQRGRDPQEVRGEIRAALAAGWWLGNQNEEVRPFIDSIMQEPDGSRYVEAAPRWRGIPSLHSFQSRSGFSPELEAAGIDLGGISEDSLAGSLNVLANTTTFVNNTLPSLTTGDGGLLVEFEETADSSRDFWEYAAFEIWLENEGSPPPDMKTTTRPVSGSSCDGPTRYDPTGSVVACPWCWRQAGKMALADVGGYMAARATDATKSQSFNASGWVSLAAGGSVFQRAFGRPPPGGWNWN